MYTDPSVAQQASAFTINRAMVSCGVGTVARGQNSGPFAMLMYALEIGSYIVDQGTSSIKASGRMRSITRVAGQPVEDAMHTFLAIAVDRIPGGPDSFHIHFRTPFWNLGNPMATPSKAVPGWVQFGGDLFMGEVVVVGAANDRADPDGPSPAGGLAPSAGESPTAGGILDWWRGLPSLLRLP